MPKDENAKISLSDHGTIKTNWQMPTAAPNASQRSDVGSSAWFYFFWQVAALSLRNIASAIGLLVFTTALCVGMQWLLGQWMIVIPATLLVGTCVTIAWWQAEDRCQKK